MRSLLIGVLGLLVPAAALCTAVATAPAEQKTERRRRALPARALEVPSPVDKKLYPAASLVGEKPDDAEAQAQYALLLAQKAREVGNAAYHKMAEHAARKALAIAPRHELAKSALAVSLLGQHRFKDALDFVRSENAHETVWRLACETDALSELGRYDEAVEAAQRLVDLKPGPQSYSRIALLREIHGDSEGALEVWRHALGSSEEGIDGAWCLAQVGDTQLRRGDVEAARGGYEASLRALPGFYLARLGLARCCVAQNRKAEALSLLLGLAASHGDVATLELLGDVQLALGQAEDAEETFERLIESEEYSASQGAPDPRGLALFLADHERDPERAVQLARKAGGPTVANEDALAWALLQAGKPLDARVHARAARRTGSMNPFVLFHAGAVELAVGNRDEGRALIEAALAGGLRADPGSARRARELLQSARS